MYAKAEALPTHIEGDGDKSIAPDVSAIERMSAHNVEERIVVSIPVTSDIQQKPQVTPARGRTVADPDSVIASRAPGTVTPGRAWSSYTPIRPSMFIDTSSSRIDEDVSPIKSPGKIVYSIGVDEEVEVDEDDFTDEDDPYVHVHCVITYSIAFIATLPPMPRVHRDLVLPAKKKTAPRVCTMIRHFDVQVTLVLDLDETLVHCHAERVDSCDFEFNVKMGTMELTLSANLRPFLFEFLEEVSKLFEVVIFTASRREYACALLDILGMC